MSNEEKDRRRTKEGCIGELLLRARMELTILSAPTQPGVISILPDRDCDTVIRDSSCILRVQIVLSLTPLSGLAFSGGVPFRIARREITDGPCNCPATIYCFCGFFSAEVIRSVTRPTPEAKGEPGPEIMNDSTSSLG
jgi:hypothetical protein